MSQNNKILNKSHLVENSQDIYPKTTVDML